MPGSDEFDVITGLLATAQEKTGEATRSASATVSPVIRRYFLSDLLMNTAACPWLAADARRSRRPVANFHWQGSRHSCAVSKIPVFNAV